MFSVHQTLNDIYTDQYTREFRLFFSFYLLKGLRYRRRIFAIRFLKILLSYLKRPFVTRQTKIRRSASVNKGWRV